MQNVCHVEHNRRKNRNFLWFPAIWIIAVIFPFQLMWIIVLLLESFFIFSKERNTDFHCAVAIGLLGTVSDSLGCRHRIVYFS
ncbi:DUF2878 family protein [Alteromonas pelagimontana]|uniref:DUF2878 family protein n=1 Tax=Alteromonas pelagimontana TaxID=1858656 RepID=A0A6M4MGZ6_9ALTE|nr:DUF2878 family protein [Alteromonas pelagimontana]